MFKYTLLILLALSLTNCASKKHSPANVTDSFWAAQKAQKTQQAKKFVRDEDQDNATLQKAIKVKRYTHEKAEIDGDVATVPTTIYLEGLLSKAQKDEIKIDFNTSLEKSKKEGWKVNMKETKNALYFETAKKMTSGLSKGLLGEFKKRMGDFKEFKGIFEEIIKEMQGSVKK